MTTITITETELNRAKRAIVVLAEVMKMVDRLKGVKQAPLELREDMAALLGIIRKIEPIADGKTISTHGSGGNDAV